MKPGAVDRFKFDEGSLVKTKYWLDIGGYGLSPDHLFLTGFWPESIQKKMQTSSLDTSQSIEQLYGGRIVFKPLPGKRFEERLDKVIDALNMILQVKRQINDLLDWIPKLLSEKWHDSDEEMKFLPTDLDEEIRNMITIDKRYVIAEDPTIARQILAMVPQLKGLQGRIGYFPSIYREANTLFQRMLLETVTMSMGNLALNKPEGPQYVELEEVANMATDAIMEGNIG